MAEKIPGSVRIVLHNHDYVVDHFPKEYVNKMRLDFRLRHMSFGNPVS